MYRYLLFDLDGTLTDSAEGIIKCVQYAAQKMGAEYKSAEELRVFVGPPLSESFKAVYGFSEEETRQAIVYYRERFQPIGMFENAVYPGIPELLECMKAHGKINLIASSKPEAFVKTILEHFDIAKYFDVIVGVKSDASRHSTKTGLILEAMEKLGAAEKSQVLMVGDRHYDITGAKGAGVSSCGCLWGYGNKEEFIFVFIPKSQHLCHIKTKISQCFAYNIEFICTKKNKVPWFSIH